MSNFYSNIWSQSDVFIKFKLSLKDIEFIKACVLDDLKLTDSFKLNDRVEGVAFFERAILKSAPFYFFKKYIDIEIPNKKYASFERYSKIRIQGIDYNIISIDFGEMPKIKVSNSGLDSIVFIRRDKQVFYFAGILSKKLICNDIIDFTQFAFSSNLKPGSFSFLKTH
jgi:hypothetical protein